MPLNDLSLNKKVKYCILLVLIVLLNGCVSFKGDNNSVVHSFSFDGWNDDWAEKIDLLAYSYGTGQGAIVASVDPTHSSLGPTTQVSGFIPVGESLWVKWRVKSSGKVVEQKVLLKGLLPSDMTHNRITFVLDEEQLYVFLVTSAIPKKFLDPPPLKSAYSCCFITYQIFPINTPPPKNP